MEVLVVGAGVIGSVYGAHLAAAGIPVSILARGARADSILRDGLVIRDVITGESLQPRIKMVSEITACSPSLVLIAVRSEQLASVCSTLAAVRGHPTLLFFGNIPEGRKGWRVRARRDPLAARCTTPHRPRDCRDPPHSSSPLLESSETMARR
jgi:2-dehydropantoate 2-reductase